MDTGLTEMEALVTATHNSAEYLGILDTTGTVEEGKKADLMNHPRYKNIIECLKSNLGGK